MQTQPLREGQIAFAVAGKVAQALAIIHSSGGVKKSELR